MTSGARRAVLAMEATSFGVSFASGPRRPRLTISSKGRSVRRSMTRFRMVDLPAGDVRLNQPFEMPPQPLEGPEDGSEVSGTQSLDPPGLVGDAGDLIQIPTHRAECT